MLKFSTRAFALASLACLAGFATPSLAYNAQSDVSALTRADTAQPQTADQPLVLAYKPDCKSRNGKNPCQ